MLRMAQVQYIKDLYENEEKSLREISRITGHSFETVQKYAQKENWNEDNLPDTEPTSYPVLGEFIPIVDGWLEADRKVPRKQRHTAWRLFCRLRDEYGFTGSYSSVKRYVRKKKYVMKVQSAGFLPLERTPGCGQVDFGEWPGRNFCVSDFRQSQEFCVKIHTIWLTSLAHRAPRRGAAVCGPRAA